MQNLGQNILFLDNEPEHQAKAKRLWPACTVVSTVDECIEQFGNRSWTTLMVGDESSGDLGRWLGVNRVGLSEVILHGQPSPVQMILYLDLKKLGYYTHLAPFGSGSLWKSK